MRIISSATGTSIFQSYKSTAMSNNTQTAQPIFPSGFVSYTETFFQVASSIFAIEDCKFTQFNENLILSKYRDANGGFAAYPQLAREITLAFELKYADDQFEDNFFELVRLFTIDYINHKI